MIDTFTLYPTRNPPMIGYPTLVWHHTAATKPTPGQRVIWSGRGGRQQAGLYDQNRRWIADPDEQQRRPWDPAEQPSIWRPEPCSPCSPPS